MENTIEKSIAKAGETMLKNIGGPFGADHIDFRDDFMYDSIKNDVKDENVLKLISKGRDKCLTLFQECQSLQNTIY